MAKSSNPSVWVERRRTKAGDFKYRVRGEVDGRRLPAGAWTPKKTWADEEAAKLEARLWAGEREIAQRRRQMSWDSFAEFYLKHSRESKDFKTYNNFDRPAIELFSKVAKGLPLASITPDFVAEWILSLRKQGYNDTTRAMYFRSVKTAFNYAVKLEMLAKSPVRNVERPHSEETGRAIKDEELEKLFERGNIQLWRTGTFALNTGLRISEILGPKSLEWSSVEVLMDKQQAPVPMRQAMTELTPEQLAMAPWFGRIPARVRKSKRKVKKDCRFPINSAAKAVMGKPQGAGKVFQFDMSEVQHNVAAARRAAKLPEDITFHCFRHTFATRYLARGGHIEDLLETRLWSSYDALLRYVHMDDATLTNRFGSLNLPAFPPPGSKHPDTDPLQKL